LAAERHPSLAARLRDASLPELGTPFADEVPAGGFDGLVCSAVLMHVPDAQLDAALASMRRQLRPGGRWLLCWPAMAPQQLQAGRDADGRVFENHEPQRLIAAVETLGARRLGQTVNDAVLASTGTRWHVAWFEVSIA
jgi:SAM-dependent methyltransferase